MDATPLKEPIYGQVPAFAAGERGVLDLLAVDRSGRLTILELKAPADLHLPMQALDYWIRVKWHLDRGEFKRREVTFLASPCGPIPPRVLLVSPSLEFHPSTETLLAYYSPIIEGTSGARGRMAKRPGSHVPAHRRPAPSLTL